MVKACRCQNRVSRYGRPNVLGANDPPSLSRGVECPIEWRNGKGYDCSHHGLQASSVDNWHKSGDYHNPSYSYVGYVDVGVPQHGSKPPSATRSTSQDCLGFCHATISNTYMFDPWQQELVS